MRLLSAVTLSLLVLLPACFAQPDWFVRDYEVLPPGDVEALVNVDVVFDDNGDLLVFGELYDPDATGHYPLLARIETDYFTLAQSQTYGPQVLCEGGDIALRADGQPSSVVGVAYSPNRVADFDDNGHPLALTRCIGTGSMTPQQLIPLPDGGIVLLTKDGNTYYVRRFTSDGEHVWSHAAQVSHYLPWHLSSANIELTQDGNIAFFNHRGRPSPPAYRPRILILSPAGVLLQEHLLQDLDIDMYTWEGATTSDGGAVILGNDLLGVACVVRLAANGDILWHHFYGGENCQRFELLALADGGFLLAVDDLNMKIDGDGNVLWSIPFASEDEEPRFSEAIEIAPGIVAVAGTRLVGENRYLRLQVIGATDPGFPPAEILMQRGVDAPYILHTNGFNLTYTLHLINHLDIEHDVDLWYELTLPSGMTVQLSLETLTLANDDYVEERVLGLPTHLPYGNYTVNAYVGEYPVNAYSSHSLIYRISP